MTKKENQLIRHQIGDGCHSTESFGLISYNKKKTKTEKHFLVIHLDLEQANALILYGGMHIYIYICIYI